VRGDLWHYRLPWKGAKGRIVCVESSLERASVATVQVLEPAAPHATHLRCPFAGDGRPARPQLQHVATGRARGLLATAVPLTLRPASGFPQSFQTGADHVIVSVVQFEQHMRADWFWGPPIWVLGALFRWSPSSSEANNAWRCTSTSLCVDFCSNRVHKPCSSGVIQTCNTAVCQNCVAWGQRWEDAWRSWGKPGFGKEADDAKK
jgi:hypothetical protein